MNVRKILCLILGLLFVMVGAAHADPVRLNDPDDLPELDDFGFIPMGSDAVYYADHTQGRWLYIDDEVRVEINRYQTTEPKLTWYIADLQLNTDVSLYTVTYNTKHPGRSNTLPQNLARDSRAVFAMSGDFYSYRVSKGRYPGNIVRDGKVIYNKSYSKYVRAVPNLATMGFWPDGHTEINEAHEKSAKKYVKEGATTVVAFGPILVRDGVEAELTYKDYTHQEPRCCIGVIEPGHYAALLVEGRKQHSDGATLADCARILREYGCVDALNLDGGNTAAMLFMGESVQLSDNGGVDENDRAVPDILAIGQY